MISTACSRRSRHQTDRSSPMLSSTSPGVLAAATFHGPSQSFAEMLSKLIATASASLDSDRATARDCIQRAGDLLRVFRKERLQAIAQQTVDPTHGFHQPSGRHSGMPIESKLPQGGLAPWQLRRAKEILNAHIVGSVSIAHLAAECGLSTCHFARSFRDSMGISPHRWLMHRRVERATELLRQSPLSIIDIALSCGFADQSHLTRVFRSVHGSAPGRWRRAAKSDRPPAPG
jgi:transcriptional regulator GlxA family with amidase domain